MLFAFETFVPHARRGSGGRVKNRRAVSNLPTHPPSRCKIRMFKIDHLKKKFNKTGSTKTANNTNTSTHGETVFLEFVVVWFARFSLTQSHARQETQPCQTRDAREKRDARAREKEEVRREGGGTPPMNHEK